jgi:hypothetical protein
VENEGVSHADSIRESRSRGPRMEESDILMDFVRDTRDQQQKYLEAVKTENAALIERYHAQAVEQISRIEKEIGKDMGRMREDLSTFKNETTSELGSVRRWHANTIVAIFLTALAGFGGVIYSIWATAR